MTRTPLSEELSLSLEQVLEHRLSLAAKYLKWSPSRISAFRAGYAASCAGRVDSKRRDRHDNDSHGFLETALEPALLDSLGYRDGVRTAESRSVSVEDYRGDQGVLRQIAGYWAANGNNDFDLNTATWSDSTEDLAAFLKIKDRQQWIDWFVAEHENAIECGRAGYGDLLLQDIQEHVVYVEYVDDSLDVWDGWHRIGASMLKGAGHIPAIRGVPEAVPVYLP
ncbi:hypothetical protein ACVIGB_000021 [Bradyrhizobium sp. USDA 4341]